MLRNYETTVTGTAMCGSEIAVVRFARPPGYDYAAGQWFRLTLSTDEGVQTKTFSHASAPGDAELEMATRLSGSAFKRALQRLERGSGVTIAGAGGRLAIPAEARRVVMLVGGVGVTPVRSILRAAEQSGRVFDDLCLFYGMRDLTCALYLDEFEQMSSIGVRVVTVVERPSEGWSGLTGFITARTVREHVSDVAGSVFLTAGPPVMVAAMEAVLDELEVDTALRLIEKFGIAG